VSVLLVTIDTLRADAVGAWGRADARTPHLDSLAAAGVRFANASTVTPLTLPAHASMLTGLRPGRHGLTVNGVARPALPVPTLAEHLHAVGYRTAAFVSSTVLDHRHGLDAGFEHFDDDLVQPGIGGSPVERIAAHTVDRALAWPGWSEPRAFAWVHLFDPHAPYDAPDAPAGDGRAAYLEEVRYADAQLGRLLEGIRAAARGPWLVIVTSDHGEGLGEHDEETHGLLLHESTMHVPLVVGWLGAVAPEGPDTVFPAGDVRSDPVSVLDVTPTVLALLDLPAGDPGDGLPLQEPRPDRVVPLETRVPWFYYGFSPLVGVRRGSEKLIGAPRAEPPRWMLYDLAEDPEEAAGRDVTAHALQAAVRSPDPEDESLPAGDAAALLALGYLGSAAREDETGPLPDPREEMTLIRTLDRAHSAIAAGAAQEALALIGSLPARLADVPETLYVEGRALAALGRDGEAAAAYERAVARRPTAALLTQWGMALLREADRARVAPDQAIEVLDRALVLAPGDPLALALRATADLAQGAPARALQRVEATSRERPADVDLLTVRLRALRALGREAEAKGVAEQLRASWPEHPDLR
jgi:arylsulfatase A-like enzyme